ncbi:MULTISPECIES: nitroreductase family protein [unclassified Bacillus (in: firmicutes)]|uniref:nitroreductase family protein n=1 Tax=unclassified Bacillus (in: firmicutes) TaxID=185979 RepID=UPI0013EEE17D|nr:MULTISPECIES: nitroreductase [unclassified Bacillus (in: firmicutes)]KAF6601015.1 nitroreductase [Bacillus sp. EKM420B]KAF6605926.1 nitroreductase [Bacillus sp. EKM417B]WGD67291.1 nitroreductase [Bacillus velezensis]
MPKTEQLQQNESLAHTIRNRRSIRSFKPETVPSEVILDMLETAVYAPNHRLTEPWRFIYAASEAGKAKLADSYVSFFKKIKDDFNEEKERNMRKNLSAVPGFLLVVLKEDENEFTRNDDFAALSGMIQNLQLLAHENGIGMVWKSGRIMYDKQVHQDFGLADNERFAAIIQTGYPDEQPKAKVRTPAKSLFTEL